MRRAMKFIVLPDPFDRWRFLGAEFRGSPRRCHKSVRNGSGGAQASISLRAFR
jgi:hypothetical protein